MSQIFNEDGTVVPVTVIEVEPNMVSMIRTKEKDGYEAVQVMNGSKRQESRIKSNEMKVGDKIDVSIFSEGDTKPRDVSIIREKFRHW